MFFTTILLWSLAMSALSSVAAISPATQNIEKEQVMAKFDALLEKVQSDHYFPKTAIRGLLNKYSTDDLEKIYNDFLLLHAKAFKGAEKTRSYMVTAGPPAAGKSTLLEQIIRFNPETGKNTTGFVYIDPDRAAMQQMPSYLQDRALHRDGKGGRDAKAAYDHWREASNFIAQTLLAEALVDGYKIAHGNTMSVDQSITNLQAIQTKYGYKTHLIHCTTTDDIRLAREKIRQGDGMYQVTAEDFASKSVKFFSLLPKYVQVSSADFYYSKDVTSTELAAVKDLGQEAIMVNQLLFNEVLRLHKEKGVENPEQYFIPN
jgi:predicted ABC-type ATPase